MSTKVRVTNISTGKVVYPVYNKPGVKRIFAKPGSFLMIDIEELEETIYQPGVRELFMEGYLKLEDESVLETLGLVDVGDKMMLTPDEALNLIRSRAVGKIREALEKGTYETRENLIAMALKEKFMDNTANKFFKEYANVDIIQVITLLGDDDSK